MPRPILIDMQTRVLVTGGGQLASCLKRTVPAGIQAEFPSREKLDLENREMLSAYCVDFKPNIVINTAAYTKVDLAEKEPEKANAGNVLTVQNLVDVCGQNPSIYPIHISTDFLFHGNFNRPIDEHQPIHPIGIYAQSKAAGEKILIESKISSAIVRTAWLYSEFGNNFMKTIMKLGRERSQLTVIADQCGSPTYAVDLARGLWAMTAHAAELKSKAGIYHFANTGVTTWFDFALAILEEAKINTRVLPILTHEYPVPTPRPAFSALWPRKFAEDFQFEIPEWRESLREAVRAFNQISSNQEQL